MFNNALNRDTIYYVGLDSSGWQTTENVCYCVNQAGYAITLDQTESLLLSLFDERRIERDSITLADGNQYSIWKKIP